MEKKRTFTSFYMLLGLAGITLLWWGLAFAPLPQVDPEWLETFKNVCFGTMDNGLPASYGWILLIGGPLLLLITLWIGWGNELREGVDGLKESLGLKMLVLFFALAFVGEGVWIGKKIAVALQIPVTAEDFQSTDLPKEYPRTDQPAPDFTLIDQSGKKISLSDFRGRLVYLTFAFSHCKTICPMVTQNARQAVEKSVTLDPVLLMITLDPWRDTPGSLPTLAKGYELRSDQHILSGSVAEVQEVLKKLNMPWERDENTGDITHPGLFYIIDAQGMIAYTLNSPSSSAIAEAALRAANFEASL